MFSVCPFGILFLGTNSPARLFRHLIECELDTNIGELIQKVYREATNCHKEADTNSVCIYDNELIIIGGDAKRNVCHGAIIT